MSKWKTARNKIDWSKDRLPKMIAERHLDPQANPLPYLDQILPVEKVGDFGCGIGRFYIYFPGTEYTGFDKEECMIKAGGKYFPQLKLVQAELCVLDEDFPEYKNYFDLIITHAVVQYNYRYERKRIYKCIHNCLKPEGIYYWRENERYAPPPKELVPNLFEEIFFDGGAHRIYRKI